MNCARCMNCVRTRFFCILFAGIFHIVRAFESDEVVHVDDSVDPIRDLETIQSELCKKDMSYGKL
jgi:ribosome-binding ATPase YchF (GTP1/OBG family)